MQVRDGNATWKKGDLVELPQSFIVLSITDDTVELKITAKVYIGGELHEVVSSMDFADVRAAIRDGERNYIPDDALFCLAPTREEKLKELLDRCSYDEDNE